jgi:hypothetical protein
MGQCITDAAPTSDATTRQTEPEIVAAISSAEGRPDAPLALRSGSGIGPPLLLLAGAMALGYVAASWLHSRVQGKRE